MKIPKYVADYVASLHESEARHQLARMIIKSHKQQRINDDMAHVEVSDVEWSARTPERCEVCHVVVHSYSTVTIRYSLLRSDCRAGARRSRLTTRRSPANPARC